MINLFKKLGFVFSYFIFTTVLFFALKFLNKIPEDFSYFYIMLITIGITFLGLIIQKITK